LRRPKHRYRREPEFRVNGQIRAREVRVIGPNGAQIGILPLREAISLARSNGLDLVEIARQANPPVCRIVDYGKFRYEQAKKEKETRKNQQASKLKEVQLRPGIDPHDFKIKLERAVDFLCEDMKVKVCLRFRGREMAHQELGEKVVRDFLEALAPYGRAADTPRKEGRRIQVVVNPLPRNKRAPNPRAAEEAEPPEKAESPAQSSAKAKQATKGAEGNTSSPPERAEGFINNPFAAPEN